MSSRKMRVYLVEDSVLIRENLIATLEELAPVIVVGTSPTEEGAVAFLAAVNPLCDLVVIDIHLQQGSGLGVLLRMRELGVKSRAVVLTNLQTAPIRAKALELGAERVFDASREIEDLIAYCIDIDVKRRSGH